MDKCRHSWVVERRFPSLPIISTSPLSARCSTPWVGFPSRIPPPSFSRGTCTRGATQFRAMGKAPPVLSARIQTGTGAGLGSEEAEPERAKRRRREDPITPLKIPPGGGGGKQELFQSLALLFYDGKTRG